MESWLLQRLNGIQALVQHVPEVLNGRGDDSGSSGSSDDEIDCPIRQMLDNCWRDGREGSLSGFDKV